MGLSVIGGTKSFIWMGVLVHTGIFLTAMQLAGKGNFTGRSQ